ncbi:MAG TPA: 23S rRNA (adenine(2503)-C(2))-methyltransferase RlmN, partial [Candidatus Acidoferrum sp.]|nr:23S rRNA (adenine(2503)-C(2))-methyltransferase RlmN [Candidatus Acidoferrum sp.]
KSREEREADEEKFPSSPPSRSSRDTSSKVPFLTPLHYSLRVDDIKSLTRDELSAQFEEWKEPAYRVDQVLDWIYQRRVTSWDAMTNLSKPLREKLRATFDFAPLQLARKQGSRDTTQKFLWRLNDGSFVESVLIPANPALYGEPSDRHTLCVSTQVGCAYGCRFCASGLEGWKRNLRPDEIVDQVLAIERWHQEVESRESNVEGQSPSGIRRSALDPRLIDNLVIMGMGEPMANYDNLMKALTILNAPWGGGIGARKITISTSGLAPKIRELADDPHQFRLAISLHGATDEVREKIMPINRKYPLKELTAACEYYQEKKGRMLTFEYILIAGVNDGVDQTKPLAQLTKRLHAKVNLIPYNKVEGLPWERPSEEVQESFLAALERLGAKATLRREKGHDIDAACGQLRLKTERELAATG